MEIAVTEVRCQARQETWAIHHLTDLHDGAPDHAEKELDARIKQIKNDPKALWIGGGDYGDLILPGDKRFTGGVVSKGEWRDHQHRIPDFYIERLAKRLGPIADKCIGLGAGNHEATIGKHFHRGVTAELAMRMGIPEKYLGDRGWCIVSFKGSSRNSTLTLKCYQYHGWSAGRLKGRKALQAERDLGAWAADAFFLGHDHQPYQDTWYTEECYNGGGSGAKWKTRQRPRAVINGGAWRYGQKPPTPLEEKQGWTAANAPDQSWAEGKNFRPQPPVSPVLLVHLEFGWSGQGAGNTRIVKQQNIALETRMLSPVFETSDWAS